MKSDTPTKEITDKLLTERQEMLVMFCELAGSQPFDLSLHGDALRKFCEVLVDYCAFVHFEFYERINNGVENREAVVNIAKEIS